MFFRTTSSCCLFVGLSAFSSVWMIRFALGHQLFLSFSVLHSSHHLPEASDPEHGTCFQMFSDVSRCFQMSSLKWLFGSWMFKSNLLLALNIYYLSWWKHPLILDSATSLPQTILHFSWCKSCCCFCCESEFLSIKQSRKERIFWPVNIFISALLNRN